MEPTDSHTCTAAADDDLPGLARWLAGQQMLHGAFGEKVGLSREAVRKYCLPFGHADRQVPGLAVMTRIVEVTEGAVTPADFYPPELNGFGAGDGR